MRRILSGYDSDLNFIVILHKQVKQNPSRNVDQGNGAWDIQAGEVIPYRLSCPVVYSSVY